MPLVSAQNVTKIYPTQDVLRNVTLVVNEGERIGLTGANGTGKTTIMRMLVGLDEPTTGTIDRAKSVRLGYLPQHVPQMLGTSLRQAMLDVFASVRSLETQLADLAHQMAEPNCPPEIIARYSRLHAEFEHQGAYDYQHQIDAILTGLGFSQAQQQRPLEELSGGWRTRALLARLLLEKPDLLLLDEPTNSLDLEATIWLEQFLQSYPADLMIVSHDRFFLDKLCNRIWEVGFARVETYKGNYTAYRKQRQERYDRRLKEWEAQQLLIEKEQDFIRRHIAGQRSKEAQGRRTKLERYLEREAVDKPEYARNVRLRFTAGRRTGDMVLDVNDLRAGYDTPLVHLPNLRIERGDRVAIVGPNGTGKTTLLRTIAGDLPPLGGTFRYGANVEPAFLRQHHEDLDPELTLVDAIRQVQDIRSEAEAREILGALLFSGDDAFKRVADLSGGQRARLNIVRLAYRNPNLLLLDEPTNHLDIPTMEALQKALQDYEGTILMVSHDRYLIQAVARKLIVIEHGKATLVDATWEEYAAGRLPIPDEEAPATARAAAPEALDGRGAYEAKRRRENERKRAQKRYEQVETQLHELEDEKRMIEHAIGKAGEQQDLDELIKLNAKFQAVTSQLEQLWEEYASLAEELEE